jgi:hypothetical protein
MGQMAEFESEAISSLPPCCHVVIPGLPRGANVAVCVRGRGGVRLTGLDLGDGAEARQAVRAMNQAAGVSAVAEHAMLAGAMLGWNCALADPDYLLLNDRRFVPRGCRRIAVRVVH